MSAESVLKTPNTSQAVAPVIAGQQPSVAVSPKPATNLGGTLAKMQGSLSTPKGNQRPVTQNSIEDIKNSIKASSDVNIEKFAQDISNIPLAQANELPKIFDKLYKKNDIESNFRDLLAKVNNYNDKLEIIKYLDSNNNNEIKALANQLFQELDAYTQARILRLLTTENYNKTNATKDDGAQLATSLVNAEKNANPEIINDIKGQLESIQNDNTLSKIANFSETCNNLLTGIKNITEQTTVPQVITKYTPPADPEPKGNAAPTASKVGTAQQENQTKVEGQGTKVVEQGEATKSITCPKGEIQKKELNGTPQRTPPTNLGLAPKPPKLCPNNETLNRLLVNNKNIDYIKGILDNLNDDDQINQLNNAIKNDRNFDQLKSIHATITQYLDNSSPKDHDPLTPKLKKLTANISERLKLEPPKFQAPQSPFEIFKNTKNIDEILKTLNVNEIIQLIDNEKNETNPQTLNKLHSLITQLLCDPLIILNNKDILQLIKKQDVVYKQLTNLINTNTYIEEKINLFSNHTRPFLNKKILNLLQKDSKENDNFINCLKGIKNYCDNSTVKDTLKNNQKLQSITKQLLDNIENVLQFLPPTLPPRQKQPSAPQPAPATPSGNASLLQQIQQGTTLRRVERAPAERPQVENASNLMSRLKNVVPVIQTEQTETNPDDTISEAEWNNLQKDDIPNISNFSVNQRPQPQPATGPTASKGQQPQFQPVARTRPSAPPHSDDLATQKTKDENQQLLRKALTTRRSAIADDQVDNETTEPFSY